MCDLSRTNALPAIAQRCEGVRACHQGQFSTGFFQQAPLEKRFERMARASLLVFATSPSQGVNSFVKPPMQGNTVKSNPMCKMHIHVTPQEGVLHRVRCLTAQRMGQPTCTTRNNRGLPGPGRVT